MHRPWQIWTSFAACLLLLMAAVGWLSAKALQSDTAEAAARRRAALEENARLALWRMDTLLAPLIAQEAAVPTDAYVTFPRAKEGKLTEEDEPSIVFFGRDPLVRLHFQASLVPDAEQTLHTVLTSPEVPTGAAHQFAVPRLITVEQDRAHQRALRELQKVVNGPGLIRQLPSPGVAYLSLRESAADDAAVSVSNAGIVTPDIKFPTARAGAPLAPNGDLTMQSPNSPAAQLSRSQSEYEARQRFVQSNSFSNTAQVMNNGIQAREPETANVLLAPPISASVMKPVWIGDLLILGRTANSETTDYVCAQCVLLDWPGLKERLLAEIADLLPQADLTPIPTPTSGESNVADARQLASLPVRLVTGELPVAAVEGWSPVKTSLVIAWSAMLLATVAVALVLRGVVLLSEQRAAFVSAVTHELRTPLTTFRMYAEMLSEDMVPDETARRGYLHTLRVEAERLTHLVANVLAYARLERGALTGRIERITVERLLDVATHRLSDRAAQAGFTLEIDAGPVTRASEALADPSAVEQILFNLVDNACKYAAESQDKTLRFTVSKKSPSARQIEIRLADRGPGVAPAAQKRLFQAFRKSAQDAAHSAPGVGLGLALGRRLAHELGGNLRYEPTADGACFVLSLRAAP